MPLGDRPAADDARTREGAVLSAAAAVVTTSAWARRRLLELYALPADRVHVAHPAVDLAPSSRPGRPTGGALLCVAAVTFDKGHDVLVDALTPDLGPDLELRLRRPRWTETRSSSTRCVAGRRTAASVTACSFRGRGAEPSSIAATPSPT